MKRLRNRETKTAGEHVIELLEQRLGRPKDAVKAAEWREEAREQGEWEKEYERKWREKWEKLAAQGDAASQRSLGELYERGDYGITRDYVKARGMVRKGSRAGILGCPGEPGTPV